MPMVPFIDRFPGVGTRETRTIEIAGEGSGELDGQYGFLELFCNEPGCDCRRVIIQVLRAETGWNRVLATINYGWEPIEFYRRWGPHSDAEEMKGPTLDELNEQTEYSLALLEVFRHLIESPEYVQRIKRHYELFRATVEGERRRTLKHRDPRRRRKR